MDIEAFNENFIASLAAAKSPFERYSLIAGYLGEHFAADIDEISLFPLDKERMMLIFIWPKMMKIIGNIPYDAKNCLVARTASTRQASIDNNFASTPHLFIYEHFFSDESKRIPIQKIMSAPIMKKDELKGVVQISRKGVNLESAGADFTEKNLEDLGRIASLFADYLLC